jgi:pimeloyl-[acyl-carrier protein] methyl ester esterase
MSFQLHVDKRPRSAAATATASTTDAPPLVCLHGWGMNLRVFDLLRDALVNECETWAIDLAGHGASPWAPGHATFEVQVEDVLDVLPSECVLLGWSFGGKLALEIAARQPARIAAVVLICVSPKFAQSADWPHGMDEQSMQAFRYVLEQDWEQTLADFLWLQLRGSRHAEESQRIMESALAEHGAPHPEALCNGLDLLDTLDLRPRVNAITQPVLIISGQNDRVTSTGAGRWLAEALPLSQFVEIARSGHAPFISHHEEVATAVRSFMAGVRARA